MPQAATIGRVVWVWVGEGDELYEDVNILDNDQAFKADVVFVHEDGRLNLAAIDHEGNLFDVVTGPVRDPEGHEGHGHEGATYASWMPYQKLQHDKNAQEQKAE